MDDLLSQNEIDALLNAIQSGDADASLGLNEAVDPSLGVPLSTTTPKKKEKVRKFDFRRPEKFSKDQTRTIHNMHDTFARLVAGYLAAQLRSLVKMNVVSVDQLAYEEFIRSVTNPTVIGIFTMGTLEGNCIMEMNLTLAFAIIDRLLGGFGTTFDKIRPLTEIEETMIKKIMSKMLLHLREAWINVYEINPKLQSMESNPQFTQVVGTNEMVVLISFEMKIQEVEGMVNLCIPGIVLEPIAQKLSASVWYATIRKKLSEEELKAVKQKLYNSKLDIRAELGSTVVALKDLLELKEGDYIKLDNKIDQPIKIRVGNRLKFLGKPGKKGKSLAVEISKVLTQEEAKYYE